MAPVRSLKTFLEMIKFSHSVFALPFALLAMLVAAEGIPRLSVLLWIVVAVVAARTAAMCFNRLADREFDAANPRTKGRALVTGELSGSFATGALVVSASFLFLAAWMLNPLCLLLAAPCLVILLGYSLTKRFTSLSHFALGLSLGIAPIGAWIAVLGRFDLAPILLGLAVVFWVAGFDILYACQDYDHDKGDPRLHSIPKRFGIHGALSLASLCHGAMLILLVCFVLSASPPLGIFFLFGLLGTSLLVVYEHSIVRPSDLSRVNRAFFQANALISLGLLVAGILDVL
jgi:4-hydroxybenzoate polyprenyltransferase